MSEQMKREMKQIYSFFQPYIHRQTQFDILYSHKAGYLQICLCDGCFETLHLKTAEELIGALYIEMLLDGSDEEMKRFLATEQNAEKYLSVCSKIEKENEGENT